MPYQERPQFSQVEQAGVGDKVTLEGVKVAFVFELAQGNGWTRQDAKVTDGQHECKIKYWRPERVLTQGQTVTVVGVVEEYKGTKSLSIDAKKGGGIASEGEPLHTVAPAQAPAPAPQAGGKPSFLVRFYADVLSKMKTKYTDEQAAAAGTHAVMISYNRSEITEEELCRWLADDDDIPF